MSVDLLTDVFRSSWPSPTHKLVAIHLANNGRWDLKPDVSAIAAFANAALADAESVVQDLLAAGIVRRGDSQGDERLVFEKNILTMLVEGSAHFHDRRLFIDSARLQELAARPDDPRRKCYRKKPVPSDLRTKIFERDWWQCRYCGSAEDLQVDHIYPEFHGGTQAEENLQTLCKSCNVKKGDRIPGGAVQR